MKKILAILNLTIFIGMLYLNYLGGIGELNGVSTGEVSGIYPNLFTPAGLTFAIWSVVYLFNFAFVIYQLRKSFGSERYFNNNMNIGFLLICVTNAAWLLAWHHSALGYSMVLMIVLLGLLIYTYQQSRTSSITWDYFMEYVTFSIYLGWISVATIANATIYLTQNGVSINGEIPAVITIIVIGVALLLAFYFLFREDNLWYPLVILWASYGIYSARAVDAAAGADLVKLGAIAAMVILAGAMGYKKIIRA